MIGFRESLLCAIDEEVLFGGDGFAVCVRAEGSVRGCESMGALSMTWPGLVLVSLLLSNHSGDHRPGTCKHLETQPGYEDREKGVRVE